VYNSCELIVGNVKDPKALAVAKPAGHMVQLVFRGAELLESSEIPKVEVVDLGEIVLAYSQGLEIHQIGQFAW